MPIDWNALPGLPKSFGDGPAPDHFGDLAAELSSVTDATQTSMVLTDIAWIRVSGDDARSFLHNQLTSDVQHLEAGRWQHSAWCSAKGRMLASFLVVRPTDVPAYELGLPAELLPAVIKRLRMFVLRSKVVLEDRSSLAASVALIGPGAAEFVSGAGFSVPEAVGAASDGPAGWVLRLSEAQYLTVAPADQLGVFSGWPGKVTLAGLAAWRLAGVRNGIPAILQSTQDEFVPQMVNFDKMGGVSFHKGCYPGQEVVARTQYLGKVKRHLYRARSVQEVRPGVALFPAASGLENASACGTVANSAPSPDGGWESLVVVLESAAAARIHAGSPDGPLLSNLDLVAA